MGVCELRSIQTSISKLQVLPELVSVLFLGKFVDFVVSVGDIHQGHMAFALVRPGKGNIRFR